MGTVIKNISQRTGWEVFKKIYVLISFNNTFSWDNGIYSYEGDFTEIYPLELGLISIILFDLYSLNSVNFDL
jgi:hypothetical protein